MPDLKELAAKRSKKKFTKKSYRPWDLSGSGDNATEPVKDGEDHTSSGSPNSETQANKKQLESNPQEKLSNEINWDKKNSSDNSNVTKQNINIDKEKGSIITNQGSDRVQSGFNQGSDRVQSGFNQGSIRVQLGFNQGSINQDLNSYDRVQLGFIEDVSLIEETVKKLSGNERKILLYVSEICSIKGTLTTGNISGRELDSSLEMKRNSRETAIKRLSKKGLIQRMGGKVGLKGTLNLGVTELIKKMVLNYSNQFEAEKNLLGNKGSIRVQTQNQNRVQLGFNSLTNSSSNYNNITTTSDPQDSNQLPEAWEHIVFDGLSEIGFSKTQIRQLYKLGTTTPEVVQESIHHFAYGLKYNQLKAKYNNPLTILMGVLRKGEAWVEPNYESPQELAQKQFLAQKKQERERMKQLEEEAFNIALAEWLEGLSDEEKHRLGGEPEHEPGRGILMPEDKLKRHFKAQVWPTIKQDYWVNAND